jgi:hypothetical protein
MDKDVQGWIAHLKKYENEQERKLAMLCLTDFGPAAAAAVPDTVVFDSELGGKLTGQPSPLRVTASALSPASTECSDGSRRVVSPSLVCATSVTRRSGARP